MKDIVCGIATGSITAFCTCATLTGQFTAMSASAGAVYFFGKKVEDYSESFASYIFSDKDLDYRFILIKKIMSIAINTISIFLCVNFVHSLMFGHFVVTLPLGGALFGALTYEIVDVAKERIFSEAEGDVTTE